MKVIFSPYKNDSNQYIDRLISILNERGINVIPLRKWRSLYSANIVHLNWFEIIKGDANINGYIKFYLKILVLFIFKLLNIKIGTTLHNRAGHDKNTQALQNRLMKLTLRMSSFIIIHSQESRDILKNDFNVTDDNKIFYVPHPNYINTYGKELSTTKSFSKLRILFLGAVKPYKNIELLIDSVKEFPDDLELVIAGKASSNQYKTQLMDSLINCKNIVLNLQFIKDDEIPYYLCNSDILALPYDISSSLNSGTVYLAFSYSRTVLCPKIGTINDIRNQDYLLSYSYKNNEEHLIKLSEELKNAIMLWKKDKQLFNRWGEKMKEYIQDENSDIKVFDSLLMAYNYALN